jgi:hypothetical protein
MLFDLNGSLCVGFVFKLECLKESLKTASNDHTFRSMSREHPVPAQLSKCADFQKYKAQQMDCIFAGKFDQKFEILSDKVSSLGYSTCMHHQQCSAPLHCFSSCF